MLAAVLALAVTGGVALLTLAALHRAVVVDPSPVRVLPWTTGRAPAQHALSRYHARWYAGSVVFLAFDVEMLFMYPWVLVAADVGAGAVVEMFAFLGLLLLTVLWAAREGAFRWA